MNRKRSEFVIVVLVAALGATMFAQTQGSKSEEKGKSTEPSRSSPDGEGPLGGYFQSV
jgi:hypothetical protein